MLYTYQVTIIHLRESDTLETMEGTACITKIVKERHEEPVTIYNLALKDCVSYFVEKVRVMYIMVMDIKVVVIQQEQEDGCHKMNMTRWLHQERPKGSLYIEFDVPGNTISKGGTDGWGIINEPGSFLDRLNAKKGLHRITEMPNATNITIGGSK